jgi:hypothetical protein
MSDAKPLEDANTWHRSFAAHASAWHWRKVGTELNRMRVTMLLAELHSSLGAIVHAHASSAAGDAVKHRASYELAVATLSHVPKP